ncbi:hypothetical protein [Bradyrhizobium japonicum]|uniref:hypothetical protein n=1 Tax=Bradyrhizobium japonicum TaxID=375 RepID=UPI000480E80F|nr:hypothetical protein [Bradyrhizobium japonicum]
MRALEETVVRFQGEGSLGDSADLEVRYDNRGEPYRRGITLTFNDHRTGAYISVFLEQHEAGKVRDLIDTLYPARRT